MSQSTPSAVCPGEVNALAATGPHNIANLRAKSRLGERESATGAWPRFIVIFMGLIVLKLFMVFGFGESLYEIHWRVGPVDVNWVNYAAFYGFVVIGGLALARLGASCQSAGKWSVRTVNASVLLLGLAFIFLNFHNGNNNFIFPILKGTLKWTSIVPYLANALFFNPPFLAAWVFAYTFSYYLLARSGREGWVLFLTACFACTYALIHLQELQSYRNRLLIADSFGLVSLFVARRSGQRLRLAWLLVPLSWTVFFVVALLRFDDWDMLPAAYFLGLSGLTFFLFAAATWLIRRLGSPAAWNVSLPFFFVTFYLLVNNNYPTARNYSHLLSLALTFPRYLAGGLAVSAGLGLGAFLYRKLRPKASLWWVDVLGIGVLIVGSVDLRLSHIMGVRLGWDVLTFGDSPTMMWRMAKPYLPGTVAGVALVVLLYIIGLRVLRVWQARNAAGSTAQALEPGFAYVGGIFLLLAVLGLAIAENDKAEAQAGLRLITTSPLWKRVANRVMSRDEFLRRAQSLGLGDFAVARTPVSYGAPRDLNVLIVFMESSYNKHLSLFGSSEETEPLLSKYKDRMELFPNFFSAFTGSIHARFATFTSLYPVLDYTAFTQQRVPVKSLFEVLHDHGYTCSMFYSSYFGYTGFGDFLNQRGLDQMYDADNMPGQRKTEKVSWGLREEETLGAIRTQIKKYAESRQRFFLTYVPAAPHYPYDCIPKPFQKHKMVEIGDYSPLYLNELLYMDWILASILDELKESGLLDSTLVVITNDHGEMLGGKDGQVGHGWKVTPELANTPLIVMDPSSKGFQLNDTIGSQVDLLPTILDRLRIPAPVDQLYEGQSLYAGPNRLPRRIYLNSYKEYAIVSDKQILTGDREQAGPGGGGPLAYDFTISNQGAKTVFTPNDAPTSSTPAIRPFDTFQESLLRNYDDYRGSVLSLAR